MRHLGEKFNYVGMRDSLAFSVLFEFLVACKSYLPPENLPMNAKIRIIVSFAQGIVTLKQVRIRCSTSLSILYFDIDLLVNQFRSHEPT